MPEPLQWLQCWTLVPGSWPLPSQRWHSESTFSEISLLTPFAACVNVSSMMYWKNTEYAREWSFWISAKTKTNKQLSSSVKIKTKWYLPPMAVQISGCSLQSHALLWILQIFYGKAPLGPHGWRAHSSSAALLLPDQHQSPLSRMCHTASSLFHRQEPERIKMQSKQFYNVWKKTNKKNPARFMCMRALMKTNQTS